MLHLPLHHYMTFIDQTDDTLAFERLKYELSQFRPAVRIAAIQRAVLLQEKAPRLQLLQTLKDPRANVHAAATEAVEALRPWITDEQWLEALQESTDRVYQVAVNVLSTLGKDAPPLPLFGRPVLQNRRFRSQLQAILRLKIAHWAPKKQEQFIHLWIEQLQRDQTENRVIALEMLGIVGDKVPIETFLSALSDLEAKVRLAALKQFRELGRQGRELPVDSIAALLNDPDPRVRIGSIYVLETQHERMPVQLLIAAMRDTHKGVTEAATMVLGCCRSVQSINALLDHVLTNPDELWRDYNNSALEAIHELYEHVPLELLLNALTNGTENVRLRAVTLLGMLKERTPLEPLLDLLDHNDPAVRKATVFALSGHLTRIPGEAIIDRLQDSSEEVREVASRVLRANSEAVPSELLLPLLDCPEEIARATAISLLGKQVPLERLMAATRDQGWAVRQAAIEVLGTMGEQVPLAVFLEALCDQNRNVRKIALMALGKQGALAPIALLMDALHDEEYVSWAAKEALEALGKRVPYALVVQALDDPMAHVRGAALHLLQGIEYEEAFPVEIVRSLVQDREASVREAAILALNQLDAIGPAEPFIAALNDSDLDVRKAALLAVTKLGERAPLEPLKALLGAYETNENAIACLQQTHPEVLREVAEEANKILLGKGAGRVLGSVIQENVAEVIGNMPRPGPVLVDRLFELLDWPYGNVREKAAQALYKLGLGKESVRPAR